MSPISLKNKFSLVAAVLLLPKIVCAVSFNLGSINFSPVDETKKFAPLANYLAQQLKSEGIDQGKVIVADSIPAMAALLRARKVDFYIDSLFPSFAVSHLSGSKFLLRRWKMGKSDYRSVIFTRKDSGIARLEGLKGKVIAFEEPFSSSGYFFPKVDLLRTKLRLAPKGQGPETVKGDEVRYIFSHGDTNTIFLVLNGAADAGAIDGEKYFMLTKNLEGFKVIHETDSLPRQIVSYRTDLPVKLVTRVKQILLTMPKSDEGAKVLREFESTTKFDEVPPQAMDLMMGLKKYVHAELKLQ
ncbi:MAG TPA: phosphate/phosphite/phosphonate ABC transporter substrate-binding protein [Acidobacteriota bacterium]|nr:phosphate/phosphite/phosphonate ABC transporter substrate-binding protein [Acidobacteriota bacterium]